MRNNDFLPLIHDVKEESKKNIMDRIYEPSKTEVVKTLVPKYLNTQVWQFLLESFASEQAARMLAMENATSNAQDMIKDLTLQFNKARQTAITTEMLEIVSGAGVLNPTSKLDLENELTNMFQIKYSKTEAHRYTTIFEKKVF